jgi:hypothetical protein
MQRSRKSKIPTTEDVLRQQEAQAKASKENAVAVKKENALVADDGNAWLEFGTSLQDILGLPRMKHTKESTYAVGESETVPIGTRAVGHPDELEIGWTRWDGNQPTDKRWGRVADKFVPPLERDLPDNEPVKQPDGSHRRPWQFGMMMPITLLNEGGQTYALFITAKSAFGAISSLSREYGKRLCDGKAGRPIIELRTDKFWSHRYHTWVAKPVLPIVGWTDANGKPLALKDDIEDDLPDFGGRAA